MDKNVIHTYITAFVPMIIGGLILVTNMNANAERITETLEDLTVVVKENTERGVQNSQNIAVLDSRVGYVERNLQD